MQVLLITVILAGIATMLLRVVLSRTTSARQTRKAALAEQAIQSCMAEINSLWAMKSAPTFVRDMALGDVNGPYFFCTAPDAADVCPQANQVRDYYCKFAPDSNSDYWYTVHASFQPEEVPDADSTKPAHKVWRLVYTVLDGQAL